MYDLAKRKLFKVASDMMDIVLIGFDGNPFHKQVIKLLAEDAGKVGVTGESYRVINHWASKGLIDFTRKDPEDGWRTFSLKDLIWLNIVQKLRGMQISLPFIKAVKDDLFGLDDQDKNRRLLEWELYTALSMRRLRVLLIITAEGQCEFTIPEELEIFLNHGSFPYSYISVDFGTIVRSKFEAIQNEPERSSLTSTMGPERDLLASVRIAQTEPDEHRITVKIKNGKITQISKKEISVQVKESVKAFVRDNFPADYFGNMTFSIRNGKVDFTEKEESKILKE